jgi:hypothetical protein
MKSIPFVILLVFCTVSEAELITYSFETILDDPFGTLTSGSVLTGEFSFESEQSGTPLGGNVMKEFELASLKVSSGNESIELKPEPDSHGWIVVGDDLFEDFFTVRSESAFASIPTFTGTLGGNEVTGFYLYWGDTDGSANDGHSLPLDESTFLEYESAIAWLVPVSYSQPTSYATTTSVSSAPTPVPLNLVSRLDGEAYYDTILDITWLADANYAQTSGFDDDGRMNWEDANAWVSGIDINGITGWRLPTLSPIDGVSFNTNFSNNATTDGNYADSEGWVGLTGSPVSELGHLFYVTLGNIGWCTPDDANPSSCVEQTGWAIINTGPFSNLNTFEGNGHYWTDTEMNLSTAWSFGFYGGAQIGGPKSTTFKGWAVHDGDIFLTLLRCDLNDNGEVDAGDLAQVTRMVIDNIADDLDCDINNGGDGDGAISTADLVIVSRIVLGVIPPIYN